MSKKILVDIFHTKTTRSDRFAQMSHQEKIIEQKKKEIQAKLEQKQKSGSVASTSDTKSSSSIKSKSSNSNNDLKTYNQYSNDGSFLDQFKQQEEKKFEQKLKSFKSSQEKSQSDERNKNGRWAHRRRSPSPKNKIKFSRFSDKLSHEPKINISTSYSNFISLTEYSNLQSPLRSQTCIKSQNVLGQPLLKNDVLNPTIAFSVPTSASVISAQPILLATATSQLVETTAALAANTLLQPSTNNSPQNIMVPIISPNVTALPNQNTVDVSKPPPIPLTNPVDLLACSQTFDLGNIPPPHAIQIHNTIQNEPSNVHKISAPIALQNIPSPSPIQLTEIPNPKPLDVMNIPTPRDGGCAEKTISDSTCDIENEAVDINTSILPPSAILSGLPSTQNIIATQNIPIPNIVVSSIPPPQIISVQNIQSLPTVQNLALISQVQTNPLPNIQSSIPPPPPPLPTLDSCGPTPVSTISVTLTVQNPSTVVTVSTTNIYPSGLNVTNIPVNIHCSHPITLNPTPTVTLEPFPAYLSQPPPISNPVPNLNILPPSLTTLADAAPEGLGRQAFKNPNIVFPPGTPEFEVMASLGRMVAQCGPGIEEVVRQRKPQDPNLWFLFHKESLAYHQYQQLIEQFNAEMANSEMQMKSYNPEDAYEPEMAADDDADKLNRTKNDDQIYYINFKQETLTENEEELTNRRKRKSRWGDKDSSIPPPTLLVGNSPAATAPIKLENIPIVPIGSSPSPVIPVKLESSILLSQLTRNDPLLIQYVLATYGTIDLKEEDWKKAEENFKINIVYQEMVKKREEAALNAMIGKKKYDYDSDEDTEGGTWEHKLRIKEMVSTQDRAQELTQNAEGKHHIGDFLPPDELKRFIEKTTAAKEGQSVNDSDFKNFQLKEDNVGFKMLQKLGWSEGQGLGANASGIVEPINKSAVRYQNQGLGLDNPEAIDANDDEYDAYRKRMMLAYRFRPNPLNNPRRPYY